LVSQKTNISSDGPSPVSKEEPNLGPWNFASFSGPKSKALKSGLNNKSLFGGTLNRL